MVIKRQQIAHVARETQVARLKSVLRSPTDYIYTRTYLLPSF